MRQCWLSGSHFSMSPWKDLIRYVCFLGKNKDNKKVLLRSKCSLCWWGLGGGRGGVGGGVPHPVMVGGGTPYSHGGGYPPTIQTWPGGYPRYLPPPSRPGMGYPPSSRPGMGYPPTIQTWNGVPPTIQTWLGYLPPPPPSRSDRGTSPRRGVE